MLVCLMMLFAIGCLTFAIDIYKRTINPVKHITFATSLFFMIHILVVGVICWCNSYSLKLSIVCDCIVCAAILFVIAYAFYKNNGNIKVDSFERKSVSMTSIITVVILFVIFNKCFGFFGMGLDPGVYQTEAIMMAYDKYENINTIDEYEELADGEYKSFFLEKISSNAGYNMEMSAIDILGEDLAGSKLSEIPNSSGRIHGIPAFASILALFCRMFGVRNMMIFPTLCYILMLFMLDFVLEELGLGKTSRAGLIAVLGATPMLVWLKQTTLTESLQVVLVLWFIFFMIAKDDKDRWLSVIAIAAFSFFHPIVFTMMPLFVLIYLVLFVITKDKCYLIYNVIATVSYYVGFLMMITVHPAYTLLNYQIGLPMFGFSAIKLLALLASLLSVVLSVAAFYAVKFFDRKSADKSRTPADTSKKVADISEKSTDSSQNVDKYSKKFCNLFKIGNIILVILAVAFIIIRAITKHYDFSSLQLNTFVAYTVITGIVIMPAIVVGILLRRYKINNQFIVINLMFFWCVVVFATVMRPEIISYYYYCRYLAPYLPVVLIFFALVINRNNMVISILTLIALITFVSPDKVLLNSNDKTHMEWNQYCETVDNLRKADIVIIDESNMGTMYFPLMAELNAKIYPCYNSFEETMDLLDYEGKSVYYLSSNYFTNEDDDPDWESPYLVTRVDGKFSNFVEEEVNPITGLPTGVLNAGIRHNIIYKLWDRDFGDWIIP